MHIRKRSHTETTVPDMSGKILGFSLHETSFHVHTSNIQEVARFGNTDPRAHLRLYSGSQSNTGWLIELSQPTTADPSSFAIRHNDASAPALFVDGSTGYIGMNTNAPAHALDVKGDIFIDGQIIQTGTNTILVTEVIQSGTLVADTIQSCNVLGTIDMTGSTLSNVRSLNVTDGLAVGCNHSFDIPLVVQAQPSQDAIAQFWSGTTPSVTIASAPQPALSVVGSIKVEGEPFLHVTGDVQRLQTAFSWTRVQIGPTTAGFRIGWENDAASETDIIEVAVTCFATGAGVRMHQRYHILIDPRDNGGTLPGLDCITEQATMTNDSVTRPLIQVTRKGAREVEIASAWTSSMGGYKVTMKVDVTGSIGLGDLHAWAG